ncbi:MAG: BON domain-containing protein [Gemmatimonadota bacterium]
MRGYDRWAGVPWQGAGGYDRGWSENRFPWRRPQWWGDRFDPRYAGFEISRRYDRAQQRFPASGEQNDEWPEPQPWRYTAYGRHVLDTELRNSVYRRLLEDTALDADRIQVDVSEGIVTLTGRVSDYLEARYAWDDAWETEGVEGVVSRIEVAAAEGAEAEAADTSPEERS